MKNTAETVWVFGGAFHLDKKQVHNNCCGLWSIACGFPMLFGKPLLLSLLDEKLYKRKNQ